MRKYDWSGVIACTGLVITTAAAFVISFWLMWVLTKYDILKIIVISAVFVAPVAAFTFICANEIREKRKNGKK